MSALVRAVLIFHLLLALSALAASRPQYGGSLRVGHVPASAGEEAPWLRDSPLEATLLLTEASPLCTLEGGGVRPVLATLEALEPLRYRIVLRPGLKSPRGGVIDAAAVLQSLEEATAPGSFYRGLLAPAFREGKLALRVTGKLTLELSLLYPVPELPSALCHPALAIRARLGEGLGPFVREGTGARIAQVQFPGGRPFVDRVSLTPSEDRALARALELDRVQVALGGLRINGSTYAELGAPKLFATWLRFSPARVGPEFREALESAVDRTELAQYFSRAPAEPMDALLPPGLLPAGSGAAARTEVTSPTLRTLTLLYDESLSDHRTLAERLQVKLHARGYRLSLQPRSREALRREAASAELSLQSALLPPEVLPALGVLLSVAGADARATRELAPLGRIASREARLAAAAKRVEALRTALPLIPLIAQGLRVYAAPSLHGLTFTRSGTLPLEGVSLEH